MFIQVTQSSLCNKKGTALTTFDSAAKIMKSGIMYGSRLERGYIYAWELLPSSSALRDSGAYSWDVVLMFETSTLFHDDPGIDDPRNT